MKLLDWIGLSHLSDRNARQISDSLENKNNQRPLLVSNGEKDNRCSRFDILAYSFFFSLVQPITLVLVSLLSGFFDLYEYMKVAFLSGLVGYFIILFVYHVSDMKYDSKLSVLTHLFISVNMLGFLFTFFNYVDVWTILRKFIIYFLGGSI